MDEKEIKAIIEALIFVSGEPITLNRIRDVIEGIDKKTIERLASKLKDEFNKEDRGLQLIEIANGYQLTTRPDYASWIKKLNKIKVSTRLSKPAMETLAIIAYKQPIIKPEVEKIRGVDSGGVIKTLLERKLIKIIGRMDIVGKPMMYGTTPEFLQYFGLKDLTDLPTLKEFQELKEEEVS
ncbi:MAG: SMC-Scp complex subunit ScpB [Nitrospirae bacterium]|nr:SMC-Scp complex subunit ScpB [Nitrospirota bacterium]